jgi:AcrR family transcriptional regulator
VPATQRQQVKTARKDKAAATRRRMLEAASELFTDRGYAATSIERIAKRAGVAGPTVYFTFGSKLALLKELLDVSVAGDDAPVPTLDRPWVVAAAGAEPAEQIRLQVQAAREIAERADPVLQILRGAATAEPGAADLWRANRGQLRVVQRHLIGVLAEKGGLRDGLDVETATDIAFAIIGTDVYHVLVTEHGWTPRQWQEWATDLLAQQLLTRS